MECNAEEGTHTDSPPRAPAFLRLSPSCPHPAQPPPPPPITRSQEVPALRRPHPLRIAVHD